MTLVTLVTLGNAYEEVTKCPESMKSIHLSQSQTILVGIGITQGFHWVTNTAGRNNQSWVVKTTAQQAMLMLVMLILAVSGVSTFQVSN